MTARFLFAILCFAGAVLAQPPYTTNTYFFNITALDGTILPGDITVPTPKSLTETFPIIILPNSWGMPQIQYIVEALQWGQSGYVMLEYQTRGWYNAGGQIDEAGRKDQSDLHAVVDMVFDKSAEWHINTSKIAFCGISYGAGLSLLAGSIDNRVAAVFAMSGWANMAYALWTEYTPNLFYGSLLDVIALGVGHPSPVMMQNWNDILTFSNVSNVLRWADERAPLSVLTNLTNRNIPVFISHNFEDGLLKVQFVIDYFEKLTNPKMMLLNQGEHATAEMGGLLDVPNNYVWIQAKLWADYWLKGIDNNITNEPRVKVQPRGADQNTRITFSDWPSSLITSVNLYFTPRTSWGAMGGLQATPYTGAASNDTFLFSTMDGLSLGLPMIANLAQAWVDIPVLAIFADVSRLNSVVYAASSARTTKGTICGTPTVSYSVTSNSPKWQLVWYLYSIDDFNLGTLLSHGVHSCWNCTAGVVYNATSTLRSLCTDVLPGYRIGIAVDMYSSIYQPATQSPSAEMAILFDPRQGGPSLNLPMYVV